ncbi:MAG: hypothetical protein HUJ86_07980, partial [Synergistes sp.]|nr:hypothetical protein [Synergistes sp.]
PAYCAILKEKAPETAINGMGWFGMKDCAISGCFSEEYKDIYKVKKGMNKTTVELTEEARTAMEEMADCVKSGVYHPVYALEKYKSNGDQCRNCDYYAICRRREFGKADIDEEEGGSESDE